ncbi:MAG: hypothetical protein FWC95_01115 [Defluviitaleaceae bacterium]|nr:hypothetical protein [Defluviitaleaceae bacterium]
MFRRKLIAILIIIYALQASANVYADAADGYAVPEIAAQRAVLMDAETGIVAFGYNEHARMYPAGLTAIITALVVLDFFEPSDVLIAGNEINQTPQGAARTHHTVGEEVTVAELIRATFFLSGADSANILAINVARSYYGESDVTWVRAERRFATLMNTKARELGAFNSSFVNAQGAHNINHVTTAYDMALIVRGAMQNPFLRQVSGETTWMRGHTRHTRNELIRSASEFFYPYATGMRTGVTAAAGDTLAATARQGDRELIAIIGNSPDPGRWHDATALFEYGFNFFDTFTFAYAGDYVYQIGMYNPRRQDPYIMYLSITEGVRYFMSTDMLGNLKRDIVFVEGLIYLGENGVNLLRAPITEGQVVATITYSVGDRIIYHGSLIAAHSVRERTIISDIDYHFDIFVGIFFTRSAVPYWIIFALVSVIAVYVITKVIRRKRQSKHGYLNKYR